MVDHTSRKYIFQAFTSVPLTHYTEMPRTTYSQRDERNILLSAILILPVTLAPPTGFHASNRRDIGLHAVKSLGFLASDFKHPIN